MNIYLIKNYMNIYLKIYNIHFKVFYLIKTNVCILCNKKIFNYN